MEFPREVIVGNGTLEQIGDLCRRLGYSKSLFMVTGERTFNIAGRRTIDLLGDQGLEVDYLVVSSQAPTLDDVRIIEKEIARCKPDAVLGVGGGTRIDLGKLSSARQGVPFISVPTTASHDGMASPCVSLRGLDRPYSAMGQSPMAVIADTSIIIQAPHRFLASGCGDVVSKFISTRDWELAHERRKEYYGQYSSSLALMSARHVAENADIIRLGSEEGLRIVLEALVSCGVAMCVAGTSRPCSGSAHLFSHALTMIAEKPAMHGEQCGLGAIMTAYLHGMDWERIKNVLQKVGAPTKASEIGVEPEHIVRALVRARDVRPERYTILDEKMLTHKSSERVARTTGVIG
jgi:glycerol-1-phosphate dehydrogenase [NAD(P)+]